MRDTRRAIALHDFEVAGRGPMPANLTGSPNKRVKAEKLDSDNMSSDRLEKGTYRNTITTSASSTACGSNYCSKHSISVSILLAKCIPIIGIHLSRVSKDCALVARNMKDIKSKDETFLLHYCCATSAHQFHGKGNRVKLSHHIMSKV